MARGPSRQLDISFFAQTRVCLMSARSDGPDQADSVKYNGFVPCEPQFTCRPRQSCTWTLDSCHLYLQQNVAATPRSISKSVDPPTDIYKHSVHRPYVASPEWGSDYGGATTVMSARSDGPDQADSIKYNGFVPCEPQFTCRPWRWGVYLDSGFLSPVLAAECCCHAREHFKKCGPAD